MSARGCADAIDACLDRERRDAAEHHASALDAYARREPSPCSACVVARKRVSNGFDAINRVIERVRRQQASRRVTCR